MNESGKLKLADLILNTIRDLTEASEVVLPKHVGHLNKRIGQNGFKVAEPGTIVYEINNKYIINLESLDGKRNLEVSYYKETLEPAIEFLK
jgi:hypothetical protein